MNVFLLNLIGLLSPQGLVALKRVGDFVRTFLYTLSKSSAALGSSARGFEEGPGSEQKMERCRSTGLQQRERAGSTLPNTTQVFPDFLHLG